MITILHRYTGVVLLTVDADTLRGAYLRGAHLRYANLRSANLQDANLQDAHLHGADLHGADLRGANLDFASWSLSCRSLHARVDLRIARQLLYHALVVWPGGVPEDFDARREGNKFHRVGECGAIPASAYVPCCGEPYYV